MRRANKDIGGFLVMEVHFYREIQQVLPTFPNATNINWMLFSVNLFGKLLRTWYFTERVNNKHFIHSGLAVISRFG